MINDTFSNIVMQGTIEFMQEFTDGVNSDLNLSSLVL